MRRPAAAKPPVSGSSRIVVQTRDSRCFTGEPQDVHTAVGAVDDIDEPAIVGRDVVRLDRLHTLVRIPLERATPQVGVGVHGGDEEGHLFGIVGIANVRNPYTCVELGGEDELLIEGRPELFVGRVRAERPPRSQKRPLAAETW